MHERMRSCLSESCLTEASCGTTIRVSHRVKLCSVVTIQVMAITVTVVVLSHNYDRFSYMVMCC